MENSVLIWLACLLGIVFYFGNKYRLARLDAIALNETYPIGKYLIKDAVDILVGFALGILFLKYGQQAAVWFAELVGVAVPFNVNLTNPLAAFLTGIGIASIGVNVVLNALNQIPGVTVGNGAKKEIRSVADVKSNIADRMPK